MQRAGCNITIASPLGGKIPIDPESLRPWVLDRLSKNYAQNPDFQQKINHTNNLSEVASEVFDVVYLAGGHGTMFDFPQNSTLQQIIATHWQQNKKIAAICHGVGGLLQVKLPEGTFLIQDKKLTGFSWCEEWIARRRRLVPFNLEKELKQRTPYYEKAWFPMTSKVVVDGNLITGQNPFSSIQMAKVLEKELRLNI